MIIEVNYSAVRKDNHQGGSGEVFNGRCVGTIEDGATMFDLKKRAGEYLIRIQNSDNCENVVFSSVVILPQPGFHS